METLHTRRRRTAIVGGGLISDTHARAVQQLPDAVRTGREPVVTVSDGLRTLDLVGAVYESGRLQKPVEIAGGC